MIIGIIDKDKDRGPLEDFFKQHSKDFRFYDNLQDGVQKALDGNVQYIVIDTDNEPTVSIDRLNFFSKENETPCIVLTCNAALSAKIRISAKNNSFLTTALYGDTYPDLDQIIDTKRKFKNKNKHFVKKKKVSEKSYYNLFSSSLNIGIILFLVGLLGYYAFLLFTGKISISEENKYFAYIWFALGSLGILNSALILKDSKRERTLSFVFSICSFVLIFFKTDFFTPMAIISVLVLIDYFLLKPILQHIRNMMHVRKEPRHPVDGYIYVISSQSSENFNARLVDLSNSGALIESQEMFIKGEELKINNEAFSIFADVKRSYKSGDSYKTALEFNLVTKANSKAITEYIKSNSIEV